MPGDPNDYKAGDLLLATANPRENWGDLPAITMSGFTVLLLEPCDPWPDDGVIGHWYVWETGWHRGGYRAKESIMTIDTLNRWYRHA